MTRNKEAGAEIIVFPKAYEDISIPCINLVRFTNQQLNEIAPMIGCLMPKYLHTEGIYVSGTEKSEADAVFDSLIVVFNGLKSHFDVKPSSVIIERLNYSEDDCIILGAKRVGYAERTRMFRSMFNKTNTILNSLNSPYRI